MRTIISFISVVLLIGSAMYWFGCGNGESSDGADITVIASTTQLADLADNVTGDRAEVIGVLSANSDPHEYEPRPSDAEALIDADLILKSGGDLDLWLDQLVESSGSDAPELVLLDEVRVIDGEDPHWWQDPLNAISAVEGIRDELISIDPGGRRVYEAKAGAYIEQLEQLDREVQACMDQIPESDRRLVTSHDALGYYADRYGIEVVGAAIPALTTQAQASAGETAELVDTIRDTGVSTIFPEAGVSAELEDAIANEANATIGGELWADALGPEGSDGATYIGAIESNTERLVDGFSGGQQSCSIDVES